MMFPSPYGDFVFQHEFLLNLLALHDVLFPSPYGDFVFQPYDRKRETLYIFDEFPSPYGDFVFQLCATTKPAAMRQVSFRPLTGILFFNVHAEQDERAAAGN